MPYIKKKDRPKFDAVIKSVLSGLTFNANDILLDAIGKEADSSVDGCLNYTFTQLLRKAPLFKAMTLIRNIIKLVYLSPPKYYRLNRLVGLLVCMIDEFKRRGWDKEGNKIQILKNILIDVKRLRDDYEDGKIKQNGDLE